MLKKKNRNPKMQSSDSEEYFNSEEGNLDQILKTLGKKKSSDKKVKKEVKDNEKHQASYRKDELEKKTKNDLKNIAKKLTQREGGSYKFPLDQKGYRTKTNVIDLIMKCQGRREKGGKFTYYNEDELYSMKLKELKEHVNGMVGRDKGTFKYAMWNMSKGDIINLITTCQGDTIQKGGNKSHSGEVRSRGYGWGVMF